MTQQERDDLDARILATLARSPTTGMSFTSLAVVLDLNDQSSKSDKSFRKLDQRIQALRKRGVIQTSSQKWVLAPAPIPASMLVSQPADGEDTNDESSAPKA